MKTPNPEKQINTACGRFLMRPYRDDDEEKVIQMWEAAFKTKMNRRIWRWKFSDNPFGRQMMLCLTESGDPVALYAGIPFRANWNGREIRMTQLIDNMSHPNYRQPVSGRKGLFVQTTEHFFNIYGGKHASVYLYGFPGKRHFKLGEYLLDYKMIAGGGAYLEAETQQVKHKLIFYFGKINEIEHFNHRFDRLWKKNLSSFPFAACRNRQFLEWRFTGHPENDYKIYTYSSRFNELKSYLVVSAKEGKATIVDAFTGKNDISPLRKLIQWGLRKLEQNNISMARVWLPKNHFIRDVFLECGFQEKPEPLGIIPVGKSFDEKLDFSFTAQHIFYTMADADLF